MLQHLLCEVSETQSIPVCCDTRRNHAPASSKFDTAHFANFILNVNICIEQIFISAAVAFAIPIPAPCVPKSCIHTYIYPPFGGVTHMHNFCIRTIDFLVPCILIKILIDFVQRDTDQSASGEDLQISFLKVIVRLPRQRIAVSLVFSHNYSSTPHLQRNPSTPEHI